MEYVNDFKMYQVLDCGDFEKIEQFGNYILKRPDPQAIWHMKNKNKYTLNAIYHRSNKGGGEWEFIDLPNTWQISYDLDKNKKIVFNLKPFSFKHTGVFPEQAVNWKWMYNLIKNHNEMNILNLFAYTGGATIACALAGANVTHVDASKGMVNWAKENALSSNVPNDKIRWIIDDCKKFVEKEIRRGKIYQGIILDPPSYGRGPNNEIWKIENDIFDLIFLLSKLLDNNSLFLLLNSYTTGLQASVMEYMLSDILCEKFGGTVYSTEIGLKVKDTDLILPEGATSRWKK